MRSFKASRPRTTPRHTSSATRLSVLASAAVLTCLSASAAEFDLDNGVKVKLGGTVTLGTSIRTEAADPAFYGGLSAARVGLPPGQLSGPVTAANPNGTSNSGGSNLNFAKNRPVSTVLKGLLSLDVSKADTGFRARAKAWYDQELSQGDRAYGNYPNGFAQNVPLSDKGFDPEAKFSNISLLDIYGYTQFELNDTKVNARLGRQFLNWGEARMTTGGINVINPFNLAAAQRPGALPEESRVPVGMLYLSSQANKAVNLEAFAQLESRTNVLPGCGTFFANPNFAPTGCNYVGVLANTSDTYNLANGTYVKRNPDIMASAAGQFGGAVTITPEGMPGNVKLYAMNYHSRSASLRGTMANLPNFGTVAALTPPAAPAPGSITRLTSPDGQKYALVYPENIQLLGSSFSYNLDRTSQITGEVAYRRNQPLNLNAADLIAATISRNPNSALAKNRGILSLPAGSTFDAYDRFNVTTLTVGGNKMFANLAGAERVVVAGELGYSHVAGLPDAGTIRYGRSDDFGAAAVTGAPACVDRTTAQKLCQLDGFVTSNAWGYRVRVAATYAVPGQGMTVTPALFLSSDVKGYSYDGTFAEGRKIIRPSVRADFGKKYFAEAVYNRINGSKYNNLQDRDTFTVFAGLNF